MKRHKLVWSFSRYKLHGYSFTSIYVFHCIPKTVQYFIDKCTNTKDMYLSQRDLLELRNKYEQLAQVGYKEIASCDLYESQVLFKWQQYLEGRPQQYCECDIDVGNHFDDIKRNWQLLNRLVRRVIKNEGFYSYTHRCLQPKTVIRMLKSLRRIQYVEKVKFGQFNDYRYCYPRKKIDILKAHVDQIPTVLHVQVTP